MSMMIEMAVFSNLHDKKEMERPLVRKKENGSGVIVYMPGGANVSGSLEGAVWCGLTGTD